MTLSKTQLPVTYLKPGETCYTDEPSLVMTLLSSSIAVIMFNKRLHFSGICHVHPVICKKSEFCTGHCDEAFIHMDCASKQMLETFEYLGIQRNEIVVRIFGHTDITEWPDIDFFKTILLNEGLHVADSHVGENFIRKILFFTHTGEVFTKQLKENNLHREE